MHAELGDLRREQKGEPDFYILMFGDYFVQGMRALETENEQKGERIWDGKGAWLTMPRAYERSGPLLIDSQASSVAYRDRGKTAHW
ncbi:hypothetical protein Y032_0011g1292 [Ancylostoma ceylanicum]|uniref:Uncharacterized protein n=1 Tax=Ancylostoma ceylanicum TaxID=53326 RepID=A0A016VFU4_9BILA|nr:hypothetical protein Y032_0011g1292 [Ancylostoma ceylanicum]